MQIVQKIGWHKATEVLGYPPEWVTHRCEVEKLKTVKQEAAS